MEVKPDVVYLLRERLANGGEELRRSLRSLENVEHGRVWVVSARRPELLSDEVGHVQVRERAGDKWRNIPRAILAACEWHEVADRFLLLNDDFFVMRRFEGAFPMMHRGPVPEKSGGGTYTRGHCDTAALLREMGVERELLNYEVHAPMPVDAALMGAALLKGLARFTGECLQARTLYGNLWGVGGEEVGDFKVFGKADPSGWPLISTNDGSFADKRSAARRAIDAAFPERCHYEG